MYRDIINDNKVIQEEQRKYNKDDKKEIKVAVLTTKNNLCGYPHVLRHDLQIHL